MKPCYWILRHDGVAVVEYDDGVSLTRLSRPQGELLPPSPGADWTTCAHLCRIAGLILAHHTDWPHRRIEEVWALAIFISRHHTIERYAIDRDMVEMIISLHKRQWDLRLHSIDPSAN